MLLTFKIVGGKENKIALFLPRSATIIINTLVTFPLGNVSHVHGQLLGLLPPVSVP